jgi:hypothetical protein
VCESVVGRAGKDQHSCRLAQSVALWCMAQGRTHKSCNCTTYVWYLRYKFIVVCPNLQVHVARANT